MNADQKAASDCNVSTQNGQGMFQEYLLESNISKELLKGLLTDETYAVQNILPYAGHRILDVAKMILLLDDMCWSQINQCLYLSVRPTFVSTTPPKLLNGI